MKKLLVVIDMQHDFVTGSLGSPAAAALVRPMEEWIRQWDGDYAFTRDTHSDDYLFTQEGKRLPVPHCLKGTYGWEICPELTKSAGSAEGRILGIFDKPVFGSIDLARAVQNEGYVEVTLIGVCTGICVVSNALLIKAFCPETTVRVKADLCACVTEESHLHALETMKTCQIEII